MQAVGKANLQMQQCGKFLGDGDLNVREELKMLNKKGTLEMRLADGLWGVKLKADGCTRHGFHPIRQPRGERSRIIPIHMIRIYVAKTLLVRFQVM